MVCEKEDWAKRHYQENNHTRESIAHSRPRSSEKFLPSFSGCKEDEGWMRNVLSNFQDCCQPCGAIR